ncbi:dehydrogenase [Sphaerisporangium melleum]|uniref:Dehydrogenase n=1 Tax=Sphaerisporangium melleum TaxID=321316 RepID=A0A917R3E7_9ACTN|nr:YciI family protein [Sphaerisporangium melleum]GGK86543.1 dehydrogenase [Sphaerisporangium melleum]GII71520.1 dehydrogenase [Sphaerisporangium melleum]
MKVMVVIKVNGADEGKVMPTPEMMALMEAYNDKLIKAGVMLDGGGLKPSAEGAQVVFEGGTTSVVDGPFTESKEIIAGYWVWQVSSLEEAIEWARQCPSDPDSGMREVLEVRPYYEDADFEVASAQG